MAVNDVFKTKKSFKDTFVARTESMSGKSFEATTSLDRYNVLATLVKEHVAKNWIETRENIKKNNHKQVYYFSMEFLIGRLLSNNIMNLGLRSVVEGAFKELKLDINEIELQESDAGLGNGGLGRLAACFLDSIASLDYPGHGNGIRYGYGFFKQKIQNGYQVEVPDQWLSRGYAFEVCKAEDAVEVPFYGHVEVEEVNGEVKFNHVGAEYVKAVPYDVPVVGNDTKTTTDLILWSAEPADNYPTWKNAAEYEKEIRGITEFLYPDDSTDEGKVLRLKQQYFFSAAGLKRIVKNHKAQYKTMDNFADKVVLHINDTHPALLVAELMRVLLDEENMSWDKAWDITTKTCAYTNHTILAEALEKWEVRLLQPLLPRVYQIIEEINARYCLQLIEKFGADSDKVTELAIIADGLVKMAHLAIVGSFSVNGVAALHTEILKNTEMKDFHEFFPGKYNNKTNGITHRRWCYHTNPELVKILSETIGDGWIKDPSKLEDFMKFVDDEKVIKDIQKMKKARKKALADRIYSEQGIKLDTNSIFDIQVKRLHEYKRQLMNVLHIMYLYNKLKTDDKFKKNFNAQSFIFGAKAASGYWLAKKVIKLINSVAKMVNNDESIDGKLKVVFVENYNVTYAETIMPAADLSEQISTATKEASGTGNMKFMMNGGLTIGTLDGANVEIAELVGDDNIFIFGLTADEVTKVYETNSYNSYDVYNSNPHIKEVVDQLVNGYFSDVPTDEFKDIYDNLLANGDRYLVLEDFNAYIKAQEVANKAYKNKKQWAKMSIVNIAKSGQFSSDRTIEDYVRDIWHIKKLKFTETKPAAKKATTAKTATKKTTTKK